MFGSGGHDGRMQLRDVWASSDGGKTWTQVCQTAQWEGINRVRELTTAVVHDFSYIKAYNHLTINCISHIIHHYYHAYIGRQGHATVAIDGCVYLMGGFGGATRYNDLWKSIDCGTIMPLAEICIMYKY